MTITHEGENVLIDGEPVGTVKAETILDERFDRGEAERYFPFIDGDPVGLHTRGYSTRDAAARKIAARHAYLRRSA